MNANCIICSELFDDINPVCTTKCGHVYHTKCVSTWVIQSRSCPCCRVRLNPTDIKKIYFNFQNNSENSFLSSTELQNEVSNLESQLLTKTAELISCKKEKDATTVVARTAERKASELQRDVCHLQSNNAELHFRLESMTALESKVSELERRNKALSDDLVYSNNVQIIVKSTLEDAEQKIKFYEEAMEISDKKQKHLKTGMSSESSMHRTPVTSTVSTAKRSASIVNLPVKKRCLNQTEPGPSNINNRSIEGPSISLPENENADEVVIIQEVIQNAANQEMPSASPMSSMLIQDIIQGLQSYDAHIRCAAAQRARKMISRGNCPPVDKLIEAGVVNSLVACLVCNDNVSLQFEACYALNYALGTSTQIRKVVNTGAVPFFISLLSSTNVNAAEQAVWALGKIAGDCPELRDLVIDQGVISPLLTLLTLNISTRFRRNISWTLYKLCKNKTPHVVRNCLPTFARLICHEDPETVSNACWAISELTDSSNENIQQVIDAGVLPRLVELLRVAEITHIYPAIRTIRNIISGEDLHTQAVIDAGALIPLKNLISHENSDIVKEVRFTLSNIATSNIQQIRAVMDSGIMELIITESGLNQVLNQ